MVIQRGESWGSEGVAVDDLVWASSDSELAKHISSGRKDIAVSGGDMWRTIGSSNRRVLSGETAMCLPIDVMHVEYQVGNGDIVTKMAVANVVVRPANLRGGWLRGEISVVANAQFLRKWDVAPRGHPNDGRVEVTQVSRDMGLRQRLSARPRLRTGTHLPHPLIETKSVKSFVTSLDEGSHQILWIDQQRIGQVKNVTVQVISDAAFLWM
ncbi:MAG: hypothetical protein NWP39_04005 [Ilumatobacteraceae bacterium]|jgi:hypothetical protein|nr:hypothetical protein [Ilumatobacteraceae bacterium]MDP4705692.1 hypothetical protein [Ilumatobacteraceae bacterium]MDP4712812.1 hypothetical protein [Ilumatobacteraceae bacterium]MDP4936640.1 hypothetical protein [Ilumatobacteraceae bacterium]MDP4977407.1 hypothetical protein [Ilumatobacteraceae bacterium]